MFCHFSRLSICEGAGPPVSDRDKSGNSSPGRETKWFSGGLPRGSSLEKRTLSYGSPHN